MCGKTYLNLWNQVEEPELQEYIHMSHTDLLSHSSHVALLSECLSSQWPYPWDQWSNHKHCFNKEI